LAGESATPFGLVNVLYSGLLIFLAEGTAKYFLTFPQ